MRAFRAVYMHNCIRYPLNQQSIISRIMSISANQQPSSLPSPDDVITNHYNDFLHIECDVGLFTAASIRNRSLVMINSATMDIQLVKHVWKYCDHKICADGGANRLFDGLLSTETDQFIPDAIKGDLDSLRNDVRDFYRSKGCDVIRDENQDHNDLDKCMVAVSDRWRDRNTGTDKPADVIIVGGFGGRLDQEVANIHALFKWHSPSRRLVLVGGENVAYLLTPGKHRIRLVKGMEGPGVSLLPLWGKVRDISSQGLEWDLSNHSLEMGGLVSSSNRIKEGHDLIEIVTSDPVIFHSTLSHSSSPPSF